LKEMKEKAVSFRGIRPVGKNRLIGDIAYDSLKDAIIKGSITPGQRLVENRLSAQMNVSRIPIREAIKKLEKDGLVERTETQGLIVKGMSRDDIEETFGLRAVLESYAAYLATKRMTDASLKKLEDSLDVYREALDAGDTDKLVQQNTVFHEIIYKAAGSQKLYALINNFKDSIYRYRKPLLDSLDYARGSLVDHEAMVSAMREKDKKKVEQLVKKHILRGGKIILKEFESGKLI
jgi:DNA-binding GntR family transcriptional regulator